MACMSANVCKETGMVIAGPRWVSAAEDNGLVNMQMGFRINHGCTSIWGECGVEYAIGYWQVRFCLHSEIEYQLAFAFNHFCSVGDTEV